MGRGQISMEYLLVTGFAFLLLLPIIIVAYTQSASFSDDVTAAQVQKVGNEIVDAVDTVYYAGKPAKKTIKVYMPERVNDVVIDDNRIVFTAQGAGGTYEYAIYAQSNMTGSIGSFAGIHRITVQAMDDEVNVTE